MMNPISSNYINKDVDRHCRCRKIKFYLFGLAFLLLFEILLIFRNHDWAKIHGYTDISVDDAEIQLERTSSVLSQDHFDKDEVSDESGNDKNNNENQGNDVMRRIIKGVGEISDNQENVDDHKDKKERERQFTKNKMTVVITSYKQPICLERMILHMRSCSSIVAEIRVNWFEGDESNNNIHNYHNLQAIYDDNTTSTHRDDNIPIIFDKYPNKLSYRFHPRDFRTDAIFSVDVDTFYSCESLAVAFDKWKDMSAKSIVANAATQLAAVGFHGRFFNRKENGNYKWQESFEPPDFKYNTLFITKGGIIHRHIFEEYFKDEYKSLRHMVDKYITAEDILMSFILDKTKTQIKMVCTLIRSICHVKCNQNDVESLNHRTSSNRKEAFKEFFRHFGKDDVFRNTSIGSENVIWEKGIPQKKCHTIGMLSKNFSVNLANIICSELLG